MRLIIFPNALKDITIGPSELSFAITFTIFPLALVAVSFHPLQSTDSMFETMKNGSRIRVAICVDKSTVACLVSFEPLSIIQPVFILVKPPPDSMRHQLLPEVERGNVLELAGIFPTLLQRVEAIRNQFCE